MTGIIEVFLGGLPWAASKLSPNEIKRKLKARLMDFNPYHSISANHDLVRATRLAFVEATQEIFDEVQKRTKHRPQKETKEIEKFDSVIREKLLEIRKNAFERDRAVGTSPIDACVEAVINGVPELLSLENTNNIGKEVSAQFITILSELSGWSEQEIPEIYTRFATDGLTIKGGGQARPFGELMFAAFAELIKNPNKYPEAKVAFDIAMAKLGRDIGEETLEAVKGLDEKFEAALANLDGLEVLQKGAVQYLQLLPEIAAGVKRIGGGVEEIKANLAEIKDEYKGELQRAQNSLNASEGDLISLLANILEQRVTRENIGSSLEIAYQKMKELRETSGELAGLANEMPEIAPLLKQADEALQAGVNFSPIQAEQALAEAYNCYDDWIKEREDYVKRGKENQLRILARRIQLAGVRFDFAEEEKLLRQQLELRLELHGEEHEDIANSYNKLAINLNSQGKYDKAEPLCKKALQINERVLGEEHPNTATSYNNLALNLNYQGKYDEADVFYQKALQINKRVLGEEHPDTAMSYNNLAYNLSDQGKYEEAEVLYQKAVQIFERMLGEEHPHTILVKENLADCRAKMKK